MVIMFNFKALHLGSKILDVNQYKKGKVHKNTCTYALFLSKWCLIIMKISLPGFVVRNNNFINLCTCPSTVSHWSLDFVWKAFTWKKVTKNTCIEVMKALAWFIQSALQRVWSPTEVSKCLSTVCTNWVSKQGTMWGSFHKIKANCINLDRMDYMQRVVWPKLLATTVPSFPLY